MSDESKIKALRDLINTAQNSINSAKHIINFLLGEGESSSSLSFDTTGLSQYESEGCQVIEGVFIGDGMLASDGNTYPVPQNYASKSLLVQGSRLKASIDESGRIKYKIISEIPFTTEIGIITKSGDKYQITTDSKTYNVLVAAITFHKCNIGDTVTIRIPEGKEATYAVIEAVIPKK